MNLSDLRKLCERATAGPWEWHVEDYSMASLVPTGELFSPILSVAPCPSCAKEGKKDNTWVWGSCLTPNENDAAFIAAARTALPLLLDVAEAAGKVVKMNELMLECEEFISIQKLRAALDALKAINTEETA